MDRSQGVCELSGKNDEPLRAYTVKPKDAYPENQVVLCESVYEKIEKGDFSDTNFWRFLNGSIWSEVPVVQVLSYKLLRNVDEGWAREVLENAYLDSELILWAEAEERLEAEKIIHKDAYGNILTGGDTIVLTENLNVKGTQFSAQKGTVVRNIRLVSDNEEQIEGKINGTTIVILTKFVKKQ